MLQEATELEKLEVEAFIVARGGEVTERRPNINAISAEFEDRISGLVDELPVRAPPSLCRSPPVAIRELRRKLRRKLRRTGG